MAPNAVELTAEAAWFIADAIEAGTFPWVLAITPPYRDLSERANYAAVQSDSLTRLGVMSADTGRIDPSVADWIRVVCHPDSWLELRYAGISTGTTDLLRGVVARRGGRTVVALRNAQLITFTAMSVDDPLALVPILTAGLSHRPPARFAEFALPARVGARADDQLRNGAELHTVLDHLGIPSSAHAVVHSVVSGPRTYVEIVAGCNCDGVNATSKVGVAIVDARQGRLVVSPGRAFDGEWVSTFAPGTPLAIALAIENLTATLPAGRWFPGAHLSREFTH